MGDREVEEIRKKEEIFCSYYLEYDDNNQVSKRMVNGWNGYSGVK